MGKMCKSGGLAVNLTIFFHPTISNLKYRTLPSFPDSILLVQVGKLLGVGSGLRTKVRYRCIVVKPFSPDSVELR